MINEWVFLDVPLKLDYDSRGFWNIPGAELLVKSPYDDWDIVILGDWLDVGSDEGCGCCASGRYATLYAYRIPNITTEEQAKELIEQAKVRFD